MRQEQLVLASVSTMDIPLMPIDVLRLRNSELALSSTGAEFKAAILLWCSAWHQSPPGSLPNNDQLLAALAMVSESEWANIKKVAMDGFVKRKGSSRLFHPILEAHARKAIVEYQRLLRRRKQQGEWMAKARRKAKRVLTSKGDSLGE